jgi:hypothetical protein
VTTGEVLVLIIFSQPSKTFLITILYERVARVEISRLSKSGRLIRKNDRATAFQQR